MQTNPSSPLLIAQRQRQATQSKAKYKHKSINRITFKQYTARRLRVSSLPFCRSVMQLWCTSSFCSPRKCADTAFKLRTHREQERMLNEKGKVHVLTATVMHAFLLLTSKPHSPIAGQLVLALDDDHHVELHTPLDVHVKSSTQ